MTTQPPIVLITGATDGIGLALARHYAAQSWRLVLIGRRPLQELAADLFTAQTYCQIDLAQPDCADAISHWLHENNISSLDLVILNAAVGYVGALGEQTAANIQQLLAVNLLAPIRLTHALLPRVSAAHGQLIYISSVAVALPAPHYAVYNASKAALDGFVRNLQIELVATRNSASAQVIHPGATRTAIHAKSGASREQMKWDKFPPAETVAQQIASQIKRRQRTSVVGWANRLLYSVGRSFPAIVDQGFLFATRKTFTVQQIPTARPPEQRHCVITGAADGIGKALTLTFAANGYTITGIDIDSERASQALTELQQFDPQASFIIGNLGVASEVERVAAELAQRPLIDLCIHNAGINAVGSFAELPIAEQVNVLQVNLTAPLLLTAALQRQQRLQPQGSLVFVASLSHYVSYPGAAVYAASKDGLAAFARSLRIVSQAVGGHVLTVYPGPTRTAHARRYSPDNRNEQRRMAPAQLAQQVWQAVQRRQSSLIPGLGNQFFALLGHWLPGLTEQVMRRLIFDKINNKQ